MTTVEGLRRLHGPRRSWWGDLDAFEARALYKSLLPTQLLDDDADALPGATVVERARLAVQARRAARLYVRERVVLPIALACEVRDGVARTCTCRVRMCLLSCASPPNALNRAAGI